MIFFFSFGRERERENDLYPPPPPPTRATSRRGGPVAHGGDLSSLPSLLARAKGGSRVPSPTRAPAPPTRGQSRWWWWLLAASQSSPSVVYVQPSQSHTTPAFHPLPVWHLPSNKLYFRRNVFVFFRQNFYFGDRPSDSSRTTRTHRRSQQVSRNALRCLRLIL